jgi:hypothetical protein
MDLWNLKGVGFCVYVCGVCSVCWIYFFSYEMLRPENDKIEHCVGFRTCSRFSIRCYIHDSWTFGVNYETLRLVNPGLYRTVPISPRKGGYLIKRRKLVGEVKMGKLRVLNRTSTIPNSSLVQNWITRLDSGAGGGGERNQSSISHCEGLGLIGPKI